jgi:hypothetical protein
MIKVTNKLLEEKILKFFNKKVVYAGRIVDNYMKLIHPVKYVFFNQDENSKDFILTFDEKLLLEIIKK